MRRDRILIIGAKGQIGTVLTERLQQIYGKEHVVASDLFENEEFDGLFERLDATDIEQLHRLVSRYSITQIYHLAAILSAKGEENPLQTWDLNMKTLFNVLEIGRIHQLDKIFFPSSIAVFGDMAMGYHTPQNSFLNPSTVYGISKSAGENWAQYYFLRYGLDVRSIRYPGIISYQSLPGGGTTDYAVEMYHEAVKGNPFSCFLKKDSFLPLMYMDDAVEATLRLMEAPIEQIKVRTSYNLSGFSASPEQIASSIRMHYPQFEVSYDPDHRQQIADSWPKSIDDSQAREDWGWKPQFDLDTMSQEMLTHLAQKYKTLHPHLY